jgi:hypothetical protein
LKTLFFISLLFLNLLPCRAQGTDKIIACHYQDVPFSTFCSDIQRQSGVTVFYQDAWVSQLKVTLHTDSISVISALSAVLAGNGLNASVWHDNIVLMKGEPLIAILPEFRNPVQKVEARDTATTLTESEVRYLKGRKAREVEVIRVGRKTFGNTPSRVKILGKITEKENGEPIIGAAMLVEELATGALTDQNGFLSLAIKPGTYTVRFEYLGFEKKVCVLEVFSSGEFAVEMKKAIIPIDEVVIIGDKKTSVTSKDPGLENISSKTVKEIPTMLGERDILKVSEMMPGIVSVGEGSAGLNVRGGSSDQNAFYINKVPVYNTSHLFGFFPAFNADIVRDFSIYKGYTPAQFGGRLSSVFNIITRQGNRKQFNMHGSVNPVTASLTLEGPIVKDKSSVLISGRSSYSDWILKKISDPTIKASSAQFNDLALSLNYDFKKTQVAFFGFNSYDYFRLSDITRYEYSNRGTSLNIRHNFSTDVQADLTLIGASYQFETVNTQQVSSAYKHGYQIDHYEVRLDFSQFTLSKHNVEYGANFLLNKLDRGNVVPYGESLLGRVSMGKEKGLESSLYLSDMVDVFPWLKVSAGIRYYLFTPLGPRKVITYQKGAPLDSRYVEDSLFFGNNKVIHWYSKPELRLSVNVETDPKGSIKFAFNQMHQSVFQLSNTVSVAPNTQWKTADYYLVPARSNQISLGLFRNFPEQGWETSMEFYYKLTNHYPEFKDGADFLDGSPTETLMLQGKQKSYGVELWLKRNGRKLNGWLAYTYSRSIVKVDGGEVWNSINGGKSYPSNYDIPHALNLLINYSVSRRVSMSSVINYQSGRPITYPLSVYYINGVPYTDFSSRNKYKIPDYFRMDLSVTIEGNLRKSKLVHSSLVLGVYNLTGRKNPYSVYFTNQNGGLQSYKYSVIGVPIFTITWLFKLGNYAAE